jgi:5S rRNA maturation endonuclease (ribonuclease M5)
LSTRLKEKQEKLEQLIRGLAEEAANSNPIVVEGKKDARALQELGVSGVVVTVKTGGKSFLEATVEIERLGVGSVILLLDFDRRGKEGTLRLKHDLERAGLKVDTRFWTELQGLVGREVQCIESLPSYLGTLQQKAE